MVCKGFLEGSEGKNSRLCGPRSMVTTNGLCCSNIKSSHRQHTNKWARLSYIQNSHTKIDVLQGAMLIQSSKSQFTIFADSC